MVTIHETATATPHTVLSLARLLRYSGAEFTAATGECISLTVGAGDSGMGFFASPSTRIGLAIGGGVGLSIGGGVGLAVGGGVGLAVGGGVGLAIGGGVMIASTLGRIGS
ncbi:MAG: hypothetical protein ABSB29_09990 [Nitrososphaerales archaeon]|jgi:hypothetical protein